MTAKPQRTQAFRDHDHSKCARASLRIAEDRCAKLGLRFTDIRRRVLGILLESHQALGAYDVLQRLTTEGRAAQPPVAYRALEFLVEHGFAHKIEGMNAFAACALSGDDHDALLLICRICKRVAESDLSSHLSGVDDLARMIGFRVERSLVEVEGLCPDCQ